MSYRAGLGAAFNSGRATEPSIRCDIKGCRRTRGVGTKTRFAAKWFLDGKAAPGWGGGRNGDGTRTDYCPDCNRVIKGG